MFLLYFVVSGTPARGDNSPLELPFAADSYMFAILVCSIIPVKFDCRGTKPYASS
jgi:hypothetical protein